jgi:hypothetical protein
MPASLLTNTLRTKQAAFFVATFTTFLVMHYRSAEANPASSERYFEDYGSVVSKEAAYRFNQQPTQFEPSTSTGLKNRIGSGRNSAFANGVLKVRFDDRGPGQIVPQEHRGGTPASRTTVTVTSTATDREEHQPLTPGRTDTVITPTVKPIPDKHHDGPDWVPRVFIIFVITALILIWRILRPRRFREPPRHPDKSYNPPIYPLRIAIKFKSGGDKLPRQLDGWQASLGGAAKPLEPLRLLPLFGSLDLDLLSELVDSARKNDRDYEPVDFSAWLQVETPTGVNPDELVEPLRKLDNVETAYVMVPSPPPVSFANDPRSRKELYQGPAPDGIDARYAWGFTGSDGAGVGFVDLEQGWNLNHQDLRGAAITIISGVNYMCRSHGTSVLGEVLMVDNTIGGVGVAPSAKGRVVSLWRPHAESKKDQPISDHGGTTDDSLPDYNTAAAIAHAVATMSRGDVLLIEVQERDPAPAGTYNWPAEILQANYDTIRTAIAAKGIVVVEAGGNGGHNLDAYKNEKDEKIFDRSFRDSGAIIVGAGSSTHQHTRLPTSNHGNRIDCYAWGENIDAATAGESGSSNTMYRTDFGGTSGASPIVAGAALILQGIRQAALDRGARGNRFSSRELRDLLTKNGTPSKTPAIDRIGVMPDLRAIITHNQNVLMPIPASNSP